MPISNSDPNLDQNVNLSHPYSISFRKKFKLNDTFQYSDAATSIPTTGWQYLVRYVFDSAYYNLLDTVITYNWLNRIVTRFVFDDL